MQCQLETEWGMQREQGGLSTQTPQISGINEGGRHMQLELSEKLKPLAQGEKKPFSQPEGADEL